MSQRSEFQVGSVVLLTATVLVGGLAIAMFLPMLQQRRETQEEGRTADPTQTLAAMAHSRRFVEFYPPTANAQQIQAHSQLVTDRPAPGHSTNQPMLTRVPVRPTLQRTSPAARHPQSSPAGFPNDAAAFPPPFRGNPARPSDGSESATTGFAAAAAGLALPTAAAASVEDPAQTPPEHSVAVVEATSANPNTSQIAGHALSPTPVARPDAAVAAAATSAATEQHPSKPESLPAQQSAAPELAAAVSSQSVTAIPHRPAIGPGPAIPRHLPPGSVYAPVTVNVDGNRISDQVTRLEERMEERVAALLAAQSDRSGDRSSQQRRQNRSGRQRSARHVQAQEEATASLRAMEQEMKQLMTEFRNLKTQTDQRLHELSSAADRANVAQQLMESYKRALEQEQRLRVARSAFRQEVPAAAAARAGDESHAAPLTSVDSSQRQATPAAAMTLPAIVRPATNATSTAADLPTSAAPAKPTPIPETPDSQPSTEHFAPPSAASAAGTSAVAVPFPPSTPTVPTQPAAQRKSTPAAFGSPVSEPPSFVPADAESTPANVPAEPKFKPFSPSSASRSIETPATLPQLAAQPAAPTTRKTAASAPAVKTAATVQPVPPAAAEAAVQAPPKVGFQHVYRFKMQGAKVAPASGEIAGGRICPDCGRVHGPNVHHGAATPSDADSRPAKTKTVVHRQAAIPQQSADQKIVPTAATRPADPVSKRPSTTAPRSPAAAARDDYSDGTTTAMDRTSHRTAARGTNRHVLRSAGELPSAKESPERPSLVHRVTSAIRMLGRRAAE